MAINGFATTEFQLVLLRRMADFNPELVEQAVSRLGSSRAELQEANKRWQAMIRSPRFPHGARRYTAVLGPPQAVLPRPIGDLTCTAQHWVLPLWPDLRFEILLGPRRGRRPALARVAGPGARHATAGAAHTGRPEPVELRGRRPRCGLPACRAP